MNLYTAQGKLLYIQEPKEENKSMLFVLSIGAEKAETNKILQSTNKVIVRIPGRRKYLIEMLKKLPIDSFLEVSGFVNGLVRQNISEEKSVSIELVATAIQEAFPTPNQSLNKIHRNLYNNWISTGRIRAIVKSDNPKQPHILYMQVDKDRKARNEAIQQSGVVPIAVYGSQINMIEKFEVNQAIEVTGQISGLLIKTPRIDGQQGTESTLQASLVLKSCREVSLVRKRLLTDDEIAISS